MSRTKDLGLGSLDMCGEGVRHPIMPVRRRSNKLLALAFRALTELGFEGWFRKGSSLDRCFPSVFGIVAKFPRQETSSILPYFHGGNPVTLRHECIIAHKTLLSPSFCYENMATKVTHFHDESLEEFRVWCAMVHR